MYKQIIYPYSGVYSAIKKNELSSHANTGMNLKCILLNENNQYTVCFQLYNILERPKLYIVNKSVVARVGEWA